MDQTHRFTDEFPIEDISRGGAQGGNGPVSGNIRGDEPSLHGRRGETELQDLRPESEGGGEPRQMEGQGARVHNAVDHLIADDGEG
jgi:hypothetical protein